MWLVGELGRHGTGLILGSLGLVIGALFSVMEGGQPSTPRSRRRSAVEAILQSLPEPIFVLDARSRVTELNLPAENLLGEARSKLLGREAHSLFLDSDDRERDAQNKLVVARALRGEPVHHERTLFRRSRGADPLEVLISASPMQNLSGQITGAVLVIQDVTELTALQRQMASSERHFAVGQMTAGLAHDFNNVLNTISQAVSVMEMERGRSPHDRTMLGIIQTAVRRGSEIVANIREYLMGAREANSRVDVRPLLQEVLQFARPVLEMHENIKVVTHFEDGCQVNGNPPELRRVFTNLVLNAMEAMPKGGTLTLTCAIQERSVTATVGDNGDGIPQERQGKIFSPYFTTKPKGTGLGLAGARRAVEQQGGEIRFESSPDKGTTFFVTLPLANGVPQPTLKVA